MADGSLSGLAIFQSAPGIHLVVRAHAPVFPIVAVSDDYARQVGMSREEVIGRPLLELTGPGVAPALERALDSKERAHAGSDVVTPVFDADGRVSWLICTREAAFEFRQYRSLVETFSAVVWRADTSGNITAPLPGWEAFTGQSFAEYGGTGWLHALHPDDRERVVSEWRALPSGGTFKLEYRVCNRDGEYRDFVCRGLPLLDERGRVTEWLGSCVDVTEARRAELLQQRSEQRLRGVLNSLFAFVGVLTPDGILIEANQAPLQAAGIAKEDVIGKRFEETFWWNHSEEVQRQLREAIEAAQHGIASRYDVEVQMRGGELLTIDFMLAPMYGADGRIEYLIPSAVDVHERKQTERALRQSEERLRITVEVARVCSWTVDVETMAVTWSPEVYDVYGFPPEAAPSYELWRSCLFDEDRTRVESEIAETLQGGLEFESEFRIWKHGEMRWLLGKGRVIADVQGRRSRFVGVNIDITERKRAEEALERQLRLTRAITDNATTALFIMDDRQHCVFLNPSAEKLTGFTLEELKGKPLHDFIHYLHPDGTPYPIEDCPIDRAFPQKNQEYGEDVFVHKDGSYYPVAFTASPIREGDGFVGTVIEVQGIAERKRMEAALHDNEERFRTLADNISQFAWMADSTGSLFWYNQRWYEYTGTTFEQMQGWGWQAVHHPEHLERVMTKFREHVQTGSPWEDTFPLRGKNGQYRWFLSRALPIRDERGNVVRWFGTNTDIDEHKRVEAQLRRVNQDLEQFAFSASHDLQEPLRNVAIYSQLLQRRYLGKLDSEADEYLGVLIEGALRMRRLVSDLLSYTEAAEVDEGSPMEADAGPALAEALLTLEQSIKESGAAISCGPLPVVSVKPVHLQQLFVNLIGNALKYRKETEPPKVHINAERVDNYWCFSIRDNGIGIAAEFHDKVFGVFKRLHPKGGRYEGTGIGLAICKKIVDRYGGRIWLDSECGKGTTFHFTLPEHDGSRRLT